MQQVDDGLAKVMSYAGEVREMVEKKEYEALAKRSAEYKDVVRALKDGVARRMRGVTGQFVRSEMERVIPMQTRTAEGRAILTVTAEKLVKVRGGAPLEVVTDDLYGYPITQPMVPIAITHAVGQW